MQISARVVMRFMRLKDLGHSSSCFEAVYHGGLPLLSK